jgi:hypothetical protein
MVGLEISCHHRPGSPLLSELCEDPGHDEISRHCVQPYPAHLAHTSNNRLRVLSFLN